MHTVYLSCKYAQFDMGHILSLGEHQCDQLGLILKLKSYFQTFKKISVLIQEHVMYFDVIAPN